MNLTVKDVFLALWHSILLIVIASLIGMAAFGGFTYCFVKPEYTATAKLYVYNEKNDDRYITTGDLTVSKSLVDTYLIIIRSDPVLEHVARKLRSTYPDLTAKKINGLLSGSAINETEAFYISATSQNRQMAADIINEIVEIVPDEIIRIVKAASVEVIEEAKVPDIDDYNWPISRNAFIGFAVGFILSCGYILIANSMDTTVYGRNEIINNFKIPVIGIIPPHEETDSPKKKRGKNSEEESNALAHRFILNENTSFAVSEAYRMARTNIFYLPTQGSCKKIVIASAVASEGKSTCGINISKVLAQAGKKVLLIDADMRRPRIARYLNIDKQEGLSEYLAGISDDAEIIKSADLGFDIIVSGNVSSSSAELLATPRVSTLLDECSKDYDYIIIDTPPVNVVTDATVLADKIDGYLLAVRAGFSNVDDIKQTVHSLEQVEAKILGIILENVDPKTEIYGKYSRYGKYGKYDRYYNNYYSDYSKYKYYGNAYTKEKSTSESVIE